MPRHTKFRKQQKGRCKGIQSNTSQIRFGKYAIRSLEAAVCKSSTIEAVRRAITRKMQRKGQLWIRVFPDLGVSSKPLEVRMGKGKGSVSFWACRVKRGQILYEIDGVSYTLAKEAQLLAACKLPVKTCCVALN